MKVLLSVVSVMIVLLGFGWLFFPDTTLGSWSVQTDAIGVYVAQRYGGALSGYAAIRLLLAYLRRRPLYPFAVYCVVVGVLAIVFL